MVVALHCENEQQCNGKFLENIQFGEQIKNVAVRYKVIHSSPLIRK